MKYIAVVDGEDYVVHVEQSGEVRLDGASHAAHLEHVDGGSLFSLLIGTRSHEIFVERHEEGYYVTVDGKRCSVQVEDERLWRLEDREGQAEVREAAVVCPMPGVVVDVLVEQGQAVEAGDGVAILEAMKMENEIQAPCSGIIESVHARPGQSVGQNDVVAYIAAPEGAGSRPSQGSASEDSLPGD